MNRKQFLALLVVLVVLGGAGLWLFRADLASWSKVDARVGQKVLPAVMVADIAQVRLKDARAELTLVREGDRWVVRERGNYPADMVELGELLARLQGLTVVQTENVAASLLPRLNLADPAAGKGAEGTGTLVELTGKDGKGVASLIVGKQYLKKDPQNPLPMAQQGMPAGRYVWMAAYPQSVIVVNDPLAAVELKGSRWLAKEFLRVDRARAIAAASGGTQLWKIARDEEFAPWKLAGGGETEATAAVGVANTLAGLNFIDVATGVPAEAFAKARVFTAETFDGLTYVVKIVPRGIDEDYFLSFAVSGTPPGERRAGKGEKPEERERLDKEFAQSHERLTARLKVEQEASQYVFVVGKAAVAPLLVERSGLVAVRKAR